MDRRSFLKAGVVGLLGAGFGEPAVPAPGPRPARSTVQLRAPVHLRDGANIADTTFVLGDDFRWDSTMCAFFCDEKADVVFRNVALQTTKRRWQARWNQRTQPRGDRRPGIPTSLSGIRLAKGRRLTLDGVSIRGFPQKGIAATGLSECTFRDLDVELCHMALHTSHRHPSFDCVFQDVRTRNTWGRPGGHPSALRTGESVGAAALGLSSLRRSVLRNVSATGETGGGIKLTNPRDVQVMGMRTTTFMVVGDVFPKRPGEPARNILVEESTVDKGLGSGDRVETANGVQISFHVEQLRFRSCTFRGAGRDGHGIQVVGDCSVDVRGCTFSGWNGQRGGRPAHAVDLYRNGRINADFAVVNRFEDQLRILQDRNTARP